jgi:diadenylate cyclase
MSNIGNFFKQLTLIQWYDILDIIIVAYLIYRLIPLIRSSGTMRIFGMIGALLVLTWVTDLLNLHTLNFLLQQISTVGVIAIVVLYQPELRRIVDNFVRGWVTGYKPVQEIDVVISQTVMACETMSKERTGALIVFAHGAQLEEYSKTGTVIDSKVSEQLIRNIFVNKAPLHDGAMIIRNGRIFAAGCVLPLSTSSKLSLDLGTRHRAGVGITEVSDSISVIVSEETGAISLAVGGVLKRHLPPQMLERMLRRELIEPVDRKESIVAMLWSKTKLLWAAAKKLVSNLLKKGVKEDEE